MCNMFTNENRIKFHYEILAGRRCRQNEVSEQVYFGQQAQVTGLINGTAV